jgi:hypothetical protein
MDNHQTGFQAMPIFVQPQQPYAIDRLRAEVPPRVEKAFELLRALTLKGSTNMAGKVEMSGNRSEGFGSLEISGQKLTIEEQQAQRSALALLTQYFGGKLKGSEWDGVRDNQAEEDGEPGCWNEIQCPACTMNHSLRGNCLMCGNAGRVKVARVS